MYTVIKPYTFTTAFNLCLNILLIIRRYFYTTGVGRGPPVAAGPRHEIRGSVGATAANLSDQMGIRPGDPLDPRRDWDRGWFGHPDPGSSRATHIYSVLELGIRQYLEFEFKLQAFISMLPLIVCWSLVCVLTSEYSIVI